MIEHLTEAQVAKFPEHAKKYLDIGLATGPVDRLEAEKAMDEVYKVAGLAPPNIKIWLKSPIEGVVGAGILSKILIKDKVWDQVWAKVKAKVGGQIMDEVDDEVGDYIGSQIGDQIWSQVRDKVSDQVMGTVKAQVVDQIRSQVGDQIRSQVGTKIRNKVWSQIRDQVSGQVWSQVWSQIIDQVGTKVGIKVRAQVGNLVETRVKDQVMDQIWFQVMDYLGDQIDGQIWDQVRGQVSDQVMDKVKDQVSDKVSDQVLDQIWSQIIDKVDDKVDGQIWDRVWAQAGRAAYGSHDAGWLSFYSFFRDELNLSSCNKLLPIEAVSKNCGWWWAFENVVIMTERSDQIHFDDANLLHCEGGPAISYPDGFSVYSWHGVRVPDHWILSPDKVDPAEIIKSENVELRAAGAAIIGWPRMLSVLKSKIINKGSTPDIGDLIELTLPGLNEPGRFLKAECPRNGIIVEGVPRVSDIDGLPIETAIAAQAWRIGDPQSEYEHPEIRT